MAIVEPYMVKTVLGNTALELEADAGESLLVKDIFVYSPTSGKYLTIRTDKVTVGYFRTSGVLGGHLPLLYNPAQHSHDVIITDTAIAVPLNQEIYDAHGSAPGTIGIVTENVAVDTTRYYKPWQFTSVMPQQKSVLGLLKEHEQFQGFPIAEGEKMTFSGVEEANAIQMVIYEQHDAGDISKNMPNGSLADEFLFLNYGRTTSAIITATDTLYNVAQTPVEFPDFPFGKDVPANTRIEVLGILASPVIDWDAATDFIRTKYLKLIKGRKVLFDEDRNGLLNYGDGVADAATTIYGQGWSLFGNMSEVDHRPPLMFDPPLVFETGEELNVYCTSAVSTNPGSLAVADTEIAMIERVVRGG